MYTFIENHSAKKHDEFVENHKLSNLLQSADWAKLKDNWGHAYTAVYENDQICAAALVLMKRLPLGFTMMYIPRGPIMDYANEELVGFYLNALKTWAKKKKCLFITFDPSVILRTFSLEETDKAYDHNSVNAIETLKRHGAIFKGYTKSIQDTIQPRYHMGVYQHDGWKASLSKSTQKSLRKAASKGVVVQEYGIQGVEEFARIMHLTEERKHVHLRDKDYFEKMMKVYGDHAHLFLAKVNPVMKEKELKDKIKEINQRMQDDKLKEKGQRRLQEEMRKLNEELATICEVLETCKEETVIACGMMIGYGKNAEMLYAGMDDTFKAFRANYPIYMEQFDYAFQHGYEFVSMGGVEGSLDDGLSGFKSNFTPTVVEYIGEFDLPVLSLVYKIAKQLQKWRTKMMRKG